MRSVTDISEIYLLVAETGHYYNADETDLYEDRVIRAYRSAKIAWDTRKLAEEQAKAVYDEARSLRPEESKWWYEYRSDEEWKELVPGTSSDPELVIARSQFYPDHWNELPVRYTIKAIKLVETD